jgi:type II secretory pathway component PulM
MKIGTDLHRAVTAAWRQRPPRERRLLALGAAVLLGAALWSSLVAPTWRLWREAPARQASLEAQTRHMLQLQAEARQLQAPQRIDRATALQLLSSHAAELLGSEAQLTPQGEELRVNLKAATAPGLAQWLALARDKAQARPRLAQLQQREAPTEPAARPGQASNADTGVTWSGTLVLRLP